MTSPVTGEPTQAVFGFAGMLLKLLRDFKPQYIAMAIDMPGKTFRDEIYEQYKAQRDPAPEDFHTQEQRIFEMTKMFGIPLLGVTGVEADDVIATVVDRILTDHDDVHIRVVSRDKDLEQLLSDRVTMFDIHKNEEIDAAALYEKKKVTPQQVVDLLALTGDTIDNIPGIHGIGTKTAAMLLDQFGSIDGIYENIDNIKGKRRENLIEGRDRMPVNRTLVTLKRDVPFDFTLDDATTHDIDHASLRDLFRTMGFNRHITDLDTLVRNRNQNPGTADAPIATDATDATTPGTSPTPSSQSKTKSRSKTKTTSKDDPIIGGLFDQSSDFPDDSGDTEAGTETNTEASPALPRTTGNYRAITTQAELDDLVATLQQQPRFAIDTETIGLGHNAQLCGICIAWEAGSGVYIPILSPQSDQHLDQSAVLETLRPLLESPTPEKIGHNIKYDQLVLKHAGIDLAGATFDTMIAAFLTNQPGMGMDALALSLLDHHTIPIIDLIGPKPRSTKAPPQKTMDQVALEIITDYAAEDADITWRLYEIFSPMLDDMDVMQLANDVEMPLVDVLATMEWHGIRVDAEVLDKQRESLQKRTDILRGEILDSAGVDFNPDSPKQLADVLFNHMNLPVQKRTKTGPSTDIEVLQKLADHDDLTDEQKRVPQLIVEYRQLTKLIGTYLRNLVEAISPNDNRIHASFHQTGAATGRLSSSNPNLQNIPIRTDLGRQIRRAFVAEPGHQLISADYSQIELRILAHLSEDPALLEAFASNQDIHTAVAMQVFDLESPEQVTAEYRTHAKTINFGIIYGVTAFGLARRIDNLDMKSADALIESYKKRFAQIDQFLQDCIAQAMNLGHVTTILGRRRIIDQIHASNPNARSLGERLAINTVVQGSAADLIKIAMVNLHRRIERESLPMKMLLQIHDELVFETPDAHAEAMTAIVKQEMESAMTLRVPLRVEIGTGRDWFDVK